MAASILKETRRIRYSLSALTDQGYRPANNQDKSTANQGAETYPAKRWWSFSRKPETRTGSYKGHTYRTYPDGTVAHIKPDSPSVSYNSEAEFMAAMDRR